VRSGSWSNYASSVPSNVAAIFAAADASPAGFVRWGIPPAPPVPRATQATGIYVIALTDQLDSCAGALAVPPISEAAVDELLAVRPELMLDGARPTQEQLLQRLVALWFPDEVVVYIGLAGPRKNRPVQGQVAKRVGEYYDTPLGANAPHAGGWPLKTLACLHDLYVHYAYCDRVTKVEDDCIGHFAMHVSVKTRAGLRDPLRVMPFANLEFPKGSPKNHGIRGARAPKVKRGARPPVPAAAGVAVSASPTRTPAAPRAAAGFSRGSGHAASSLAERDGEGHRGGPGAHPNRSYQAILPPAGRTSRFRCAAAG